MDRFRKEVIQVGTQKHDIIFSICTITFYNSIFLIFFFNFFFWDEIFFWNIILKSKFTIHMKISMKLITLIPTNRPNVPPTKFKFHIKRFKHHIISENFHSLIEIWSVRVDLKYLTFLNILNFLRGVIFSFFEKTLSFSVIFGKKFICSRFTVVGL